MRIVDVTRAEECRQLFNRCADCARRFAIEWRIRFGVYSVDVQSIVLTIKLGIDPANQPIAVQDRQDVVAELALGRRCVYFDAEIEVKQLRRPRSIADEVVEG